MHSTAKSRLLLEWLAYWAVALLLQAVRHDWTGWSGNEDEPAHFLTGVMLRDFIAGHLVENPLAYAQNYYDHYPKIAIGHWPPVFYLLQGVWYLVVSPGYVQALILMAAVSAGVALLISLETSRFDRQLGYLMGGLWLLLPSVREAGGRVMAELVVTLFAFAAVCVYARYLEEPGILRGVGFGFLAVLAILTKATGAVLAAVPISAILLWRWRLLARLSYWIPLPIVAACCLPWYLLAPGARHDRALPMGGPGLMPNRGRHFLSGEELLPWALWLAAAAALLYAIWHLRRFPFAAAGLALIAANFVGASTLAVWELRHAVMIIPILLVFIAYAIHRSGRRSIAAAVVVVAAVYCLTLDRPPQRTNLQFAEAARLARGVSPVLVAGYADVEGGFICEYAVQERRPGGVVMRGTKALVSMTWFGRLIEERFHSPEEVARFLAFENVKLILLDRKTNFDRVDTRLLNAVVHQSPGKWEQVPLANSRLEMWRRVAR